MERAAIAEAGGTPKATTLARKVAAAVANDFQKNIVVWKRS
jgi:hypothetical protein